MLTRLLLLVLALAAHADDGEDPLNALENNSRAFMPATPPPSITGVPAPIMTPIYASCGRLAPGQSAMVDFSTPSSLPTGIPARYRHSRPNEKLFVAEVNVQYKAAVGYDGPWTPTQVSEQYQAKLAACLAEHGEVYKDPATGARLDLRVAHDLRVPVQVVKIGNRKVRSNSKLYQSDAGCALMLHESLHLVGLVDEYPERAKEVDAELVIVRQVPNGLKEVTTQKVKMPSPDCRALGPSTSVMYRQSCALS
jgi:hypothetical protein